MLPDAPCATAQLAIPTDGTSQTRCQKVWVGLKAISNHFLNAQDPAVDADIIGYCFLLPLSLYWMHTRPHIDTQWAVCFGTIWGAVGLKAYMRRRGGDQ